MNPSKMSPTMTPFLYQTRTLSVLHPSRLIKSNTIFSSHGRSFKICHNFGAPRARHDSPFEKVPYIPMAKVPSPFERTIDAPEGNYDSKVVIRKFAFDKAPKKRLRTNEESIPFEEADQDVTDMDFMSTSDPFLVEQDVFDENYTELDQSRESERGHDGKQSTITLQERDAFRKIFADIQAFSQQPANTRLNELDSDDPSLSPTPQQKAEAEDSLLAIMENSTTARHAFSLKSQDKLLQDVEEYPQPLRAAAARALGLVKNKEEFEEESMEDEKLEELRLPELDRVEQLMRNAKTDIKLWQVMEEEVFSLPGRLGLVDEDVSPVQPKRGRKKTPLDKDAAGAGVKKGTEAGSQLNLSVYGPLYPSHLLLGLRLLDRSFQKPSPLVLKILPRIKSLGLISHALGASTVLYNELLRIFWMRYDNFHTVAALVKEMENVGLEFDDETLSILVDIDRAQTSVRRGGKGPMIKALWQMPEFAPGFCKSWIPKIEHLLDKRKEAEMPSRREKVKSDLYL